MNQQTRNIPARPPLNKVIGTPDLCAWQPVRGVVWIQTRHPKHSARLSKRSDSKRVASGMNVYLRTFEFTRKSLAWAARLIERYTSNETGANEPLDNVNQLPEARLETGLQEDGKTPEAKTEGSNASLVTVKDGTSHPSFTPAGNGVTV